MPVTHRGPLRVPLPLRTNDIVDLLFHQLGQDAEPDADAQRQQPFLRCPDQLAESFLHALREHSLITGRLSDRYVATHGGSSLDLWRIAANAPIKSGRGRRDRRHIKVLRAPGQPLAKYCLSRRIGAVSAGQHGSEALESMHVAFWTLGRPSWFR